MFGQNSYKFTDELHKDFDFAENRLSNGHKYDLTTSIFEKLPEVFCSNKNCDDKQIQIVGRINSKREFRWIKKKYIKDNKNLNKYKVILPKSNGSGALGEVLSTPLIGEPLIGEPLIGHTQTFVSIGCFDTYSEAENCMKYIKGKFARAMLGILKITQDNPPEKWKFVPLQDFTDNSDIDWSKSIHDIDLQLYKKYGLSQDEIDFIEEKVQVME